MKKNVPLTVLKAIEPLIAKIKPEDLVVVKNPSTIFKVLDGEAGSEFYFEIVSIKNVNSTVIAEINYKPANENNIDVYRNTVPVENVGAHFNKWHGILDGYQQVTSVFDDPILEKYEDEFYAKFESADDDAQSNSFTLEQQIVLDDAVTKVIYLLKGKEEENPEVIAAIIKEAEELQAEITTSTKAEIFHKLSKLFAKIQKGSLKWIKEIYPIIQKEIIAQVVKGALQLPSIIDIIQ